MHPRLRERNLSGRHGVPKPHVRRPLLLALAGGSFLLEPVNIHSPIVHGNAHDVQAMVGEYLEGQEVARLLDNNGVARPGEQGADKIQGL